MALALLTIKARQTYLKGLGFYSGPIDGKSNAALKKAYLKLQKRYFTRKKDIDGIYGHDTDILLRSAWNVHKYGKDFELKEFKCHCGGQFCTGYPDYVRAQLVANAQTLRNEAKSPMIITSALRCKEWNRRQSGSAANSRHLTGKAIDFYCKPLTGTYTARVKTLKRVAKLPKFRYAYGNTENMGNCIHFDIK